MNDRLNLGYLIWLFEFAGAYRHFESLNLITNFHDKKENSLKTHFNDNFAGQIRRTGHFRLIFNKSLSDQSLAKGILNDRRHSRLIFDRTVIF